MILHGSPFLLAALAASTLTAPNAWKGILDAKDGSFASGSARVEAVGTDSVRATIELTGAPAGSQLPWHVHAGACGAMGKILGDQTAYAPLKVSPEGKATTVVTIPIQLMAQGQYSVTVHKSSSDMSPIVCGNLAAEGADTTSIPAIRRDTTTRP